MLRCASVWKRRSSVLRCKSVAVDELEVKQVWTGRPCSVAELNVRERGKLRRQICGRAWDRLGRFGDNLCMQQRAK